MRHRLSALLGRKFRLFAMLAAGGGLAAALWTQRRGITGFPWRLSWPMFIAAVLVFASTPLFGATAFWVLTRALTGTTSFGMSIHVWMRGFVARYVPLGALTVAVRLRAATRLGASRAQVLLATAYEQVAAIVAGGIAATIGLAVSGERPPVWVVALLGGLIGAAGLVAATAFSSRRLLRTAPLRALGLAAVTNCVGWGIAGTGAWVLVNAVSGSSPTLAFMTGAYALAWLAGFVVPFAPSGLGAREATFVAIFAPHFGFGPATAIAVMLRFANIVGDLLVVGLVEVFAFLRSAPPARATLGIS